MSLQLICVTILPIVAVLVAIQVASVNSQTINENAVLQPRLGRKILSADHSVDYVIRPSDTDAVVNGSATLNCKINSVMTSTSVKWFGPPNFHFRTEGRSSGHPRYSVTGGEGEYNLFISPVRPEDGGMFRCWVRELRGEPAEAMLTVLTQTEAPGITGYSNPVREGTTLTLSCTSHGGDPPPTLSWSLGAATFEGTTDDNEIRATIRITREHHGQVVACTALQPGYPYLLHPLTTQITLEVLYAPLVSITVSSPDMTTDGATVQVIEGEPVTISCNVESNPPSTITWEVPRSVPLPLEPEFHISAIRGNQRGTFSCTAANSIATTTKMVIVEVLYPPRIMTNVKHKQVTVGAKLTLTCAAEGNPVPKVTWLNSSNTNSAILANPLVIPAVTYSMTGKYVCIAASSRFGRDEKEVFIEVTGKPVVMPSSDVVYAEVGSAVELRCEVGAVPPVNESFWSWTESDGNRTALWSNGTKHRFSAYQLLSARGVTMVLAIDNVMPDDFTHYTCTAINRFGQDSRVLMLKPSMGTTYPSLSLPLLVGLGCSACVVCLVLLYFTKRCCHLVRKTEENDQFEIEHTVLQPLNGTSNGHAVRFQSMDVTDSTIHLQTPVDNARSETQGTRDGQNSSDVQRHRHRDEEDLVGPDIHGQSEYQLPHENDHITYMYHSRDSDAHVVEPEGRDMEFNPDQISFLEELGEGQFGKVHKAKAHIVHDQARSSTMIVAVKTVKAHASSEVRDDMLKELRMMMRLLDPHPNVVTLLGYCTKSDPVMLVVEYVPNGDLLSFLRNDRAARNVTYANLHTESRTLQNTDLISFAWQVSKGMCYLASKQCIHRDLAARNVLVGKNKTCKVSDFGLARDGPEYKKVKDSPLPLRWMAPETLSIERLYTTKSDVWSFGVLLYEIVTLGSTPYPTMSAQQAALEVQMGMILQKPAHCTDDLYFIMENCWHFLPDERPPFSELSAALSRLVVDEKDHIMLNQYDEHQYANLERSAEEVC